MNDHHHHQLEDYLQLSYPTNPICRLCRLGVPKCDDEHPWKGQAERRAADPLWEDSDE